MPERRGDDTVEGRAHELEPSVGETLHDLCRCVAEVLAL
jgi:hypothetical protein